MAGLSTLRVPEVIELRDVRADQLAPILAEETESWRAALEWDFRPSGDLVRRFVGMQALSGYALALDGAVLGYAYYVCEDHKGLIGDLYIVREFATIDNENRLMGAIVKALMSTPFVRRIEAQLMLVDPMPARTIPQASFHRAYPRNFMMANLAGADALPEGRAANKLSFETWSDSRQEDCAHLIAGAYRGHIDSEVNDQYRSVGGARRFLNNIIQYPGCGSFFQPASWIAVDPDTGGACGVVLASLVAADIGHITQICVSPALKGKGAGYELMRRALCSLAARGCRKSSLTVTSSNAEAVSLYERIGFATTRTFFAYVWDGF